MVRQITCLNTTQQMFLRLKKDGGSLCKVLDLNTEIKLSVEHGWMCTECKLAGGDILESVNKPWVGLGVLTLLSK